MFGTLKSLTKAIIGVATLPVDIVADVVTLGGVVNDKPRPYTAGKLMWHCTCNLKPCVGLECGVYIPGRAPRKHPDSKPFAVTSEIRKQAWQTRRAKYGPKGHA